MSVTDIPRRFDNPPDSRVIRPSPGKRGRTVLGGILLVLLVFLLVAESSIGTETRAGGSDSTADTVSLLVAQPVGPAGFIDRKSTRLNSSHANISYAVFCLKKKKIEREDSSEKAT